MRAGHRCMDKARQRCHERNDVRVQTFFSEKRTNPPHGGALTFCSPLLTPLFPPVSCFFCSVFLHSPLFDTSRLCPSILQLNPVFFPSALSASPILLHHPLLDLSLTLCLFFFFTFTSSFILSSWKAYAVLPPCLSTQIAPFSGLKSEFVDYARNHFHASWSQSEALTTEVGKKERHVTASLLLLMTYI